jgi:cobalt/nickel transport system permease protein
VELPVWLQESNVGMCPCGCIGKRSKKNFVEKTLLDLSKVVRETIFSENIARSHGVLQVLDPRTKLIGFSFLLVTISLVHNLSLLALAYLAIATLAILSKIPIAMFIKRVWLVVPLFTAIMLIPALFNWIRPGTPLLILWDFGHPLNIGPFHTPSTLAITQQGVKGAILMILRVGVSVSLTVVLTLTTRWTDLLKGLRVLCVPKIFVTTMEMTYRYIFVLLSIVEEMFFARKSRMVGATDLKENRRFIAASMGTLFGKSQAMSEEVYASMLARGYTGEIRTINRLKFSLWDCAAIIMAVLLSLLLFAANKVIGGIL